jgi:hypothetical protein
VDGELQDGSWFKAKDFTVTNRSEIMELDYLGETETDLDFQHHGYDFGFSVDMQDRKTIAFLNKIVERDQLHLTHPKVTMTVIYAFKDGSSTTEMYYDAVLRPTSTSFGARKDGVVVAFEGKCKKRLEAQP